MTAYNLGQLIGVLIWVVIIVAVVRTIINRRKARQGEGLPAADPSGPTPGG